MKSGKYEEWFDVAFDRAVSSSSLTKGESKRASWKKVQAQIEQVNRNRKRRRRIQLSGIVAASFLAGAILFSPSSVIKAISPIVKSVVDMGNGMIGIVIKNGEVPPSVVTPKTVKPDDFLDENENGEMTESLLYSYTWENHPAPESMDEIQSQLSFHLPDLRQLPTEFHLQSYTTSDPSEVENKFDKVALKFTNNEEQTLWVQIIHLRTYSSIMSTVPQETEKLQIGSDEVYFTPGSYNQLFGTNGNLLIQIGSELPKDVLIQFYKSLQTK
ncbi:hypothetical protein MUG84_11925 [Paenibacillus sp. KQZ6P-2]|uniref:DUF4367 domain-containing protein n=1 Tax=Paenibacillus mangrovi TaxID=2931978 RepID=A0A9X1WPQ6_9BACL|nr:hypothetical protein [Paenibacillus mangrovi]MCJ8012441.1 hypothetical protein [Paenibacillus mangrovi]